MSGSLIQLAAKGAQDAYITNSAGVSLFRTKYTRHKNFSQAPKLIKILTNKDSTVIIPSYGDLLDGLWLEGTMPAGATKEALILSYEHDPSRPLPP